MDTRTAALLGEAGIEKLRRAHVAVFGLGGVGSYTAEALARCGVGALTLVDSDRVAASNINRQLVATCSAIGRYKAEVMAERIADIRPDCTIRVRAEYFDESTAETYDFTEFSYVADAIDSVPSKVLLIQTARMKNIPVISCMGAGNKLDPTAFRVADLEHTKVCPLAKIVRRELSKRGICGVKAVYSEEAPRAADRSVAAPGEKFIGSVAFVPSVAGLILAVEIVKDLCAM